MYVLTQCLGSMEMPTRLTGVQPRPRALCREFRHGSGELWNRTRYGRAHHAPLNSAERSPPAGRVTLSNLRLKKGALDKFRLPVDVIEGHLGCITRLAHDAH